MNYNFTDRVRKVLQMAGEEARRLRHDYVGTEHILLGLICVGEGLAVVVFNNLCVDLERIQEEVEERVRRGRYFISLEGLPYTSRAKKVLELAMAEARELNHSYVGTEHLLMGLLRERKGIAAEVLGALGVHEEDARREIVKLLAGEPAAHRSPDILADRVPVDFGPTPRDLLASAFTGYRLRGYDRISLLTDPDAEAAPEVAELMAALHSLAHAWGGPGLAMEHSHVRILVDIGPLLVTGLREPRASLRGYLAASAAAAVHYLLARGGNSWEAETQPRRESFARRVASEGVSVIAAPPLQRWLTLLDAGKRAAAIEDAYIRIRMREETSPPASLEAAWKRLEEAVVSVVPLAGPVPVLQLDALGTAIDLRGRGAEPLPPESFASRGEIVPRVFH